MSRHAWVYPGAPACDAKEWLAKAKMDVIRVEFFRVNAKGGLQRINEVGSNLAGTCNGFSAANVSAFKNLAKTREVLVTVAGHDIDGLRLLFARAAAVTDQLTNFVVRQGLGGIDIDFENIGAWTAADFDAFVRFLTMLGKKLQPKGRKLSVCCPLWHENPSRPPFNWDYSKLASLPIDYFSIMGYDLMYDFGGGTPIAPLAWLREFLEYLVKVLPKQKVIMGLPAYGYSATVGAWHDIRIRTKTQAISAGRFTNAVRDPSSAELKSLSGNTVWFINDKTSLEAKAAIGRELGVGGFCLWHAGGGNDFI